MDSFEFATKVLEHEKRDMKVLEIYKIGEKLGLNEKLNFKGKTPWKTLSARIYMDLKNNPDTIFEITQEKSLKIKLKNQILSQTEPKLTKKVRQKI